MSNPPSNRTPPGPSFRSSAVARMAQMPVATLRIWEQRYGAVRPATTPTGHRLYSPADVQRVLLLRQLTEQGHAIGSIAALDALQLQQIVEGPTGARPAVRRTPSRAVAPATLVIVGPALALRLQRPGVAGCLSPSPRVLAVFETLTEATRAAVATRADLLLWHAPELPPAPPRELKAAERAWRVRRTGVVYRFASASAMRSITGTGAALLREPPDDEAVGTWLASLAAALPSRPRAPSDGTRGRRHPAPSAGGVAPRRFDDAALTALAGLSPTLACECPRHVAELLMQLSSFERYSATCVHRDAADAALHEYLHQVAGASRAMFESALERVARHEGLPLP